MDDTRARLIKCFQAVFPDLREMEADRASTATMAAWDSVSTLSLVSLIEEEFQTSIDPEDLDNFVSFDLILDHFRSRDQGASAI